MKDVNDMTVGELVENGWKVELKKYDAMSEMSARINLLPFTSIGKTIKYENEGTHWASIYTDNIDVTVFYEEVKK